MCTHPTTRHTHHATHQHPTITRQSEICYKKMRSQKAPGPTGITMDIIKSLTQPSLPNKHPNFLKDTELSNEFLHHLHHIITKFWNKEIQSYPEWQHGTLTPVPKKWPLQPKQMAPRTPTWDRLQIISIHHCRKNESNC